MKTLRQLCVASVIALMFMLPAFAGEISTTVAPPPPAATGQIETPLAGQIETRRGEATATDSLTQAALSLIQSMLSLF